MACVLSSIWMLLLCVSQPPQQLLAVKRPADWTTMALSLCQRKEANVAASVCFTLVHRRSHLERMHQVSHVKFCPTLQQSLSSFQIVNASALWELSTLLLGESTICMHEQHSACVTVVPLSTQLLAMSLSSLPSTLRPLDISISVQTSPTYPTVCSLWFCPMGEEEMSMHLPFSLLLAHTMDRVDSSYSCRCFGYRKGS